MNPTDQAATEFAIVARERFELNMLLLSSGARDLKAISDAIEAYAIAKARAAVAVARQVQEERDQ